MAALFIAISSDSLEESVKTSSARIILFGTIPTAIPATVPVVNLPVISTLPHTSSFLYTNLSDNDTSERPPSQDPYEVTVARWRSPVAARSSPPSSPTDMTLPIRHILPTPPNLPHRPAVLVLPGQSIPIGLPYRRLASRYPPDHSSSNHFSSDDSSSDYPLDSLSGYSLNTSLVPIATPISEALSPVRVDLLPPRKRIRGSISMTDFEADIDACIAAADATEAGETNVKVEVGIKTKAEVGEEANAEIQPEGTIKIGVDVAIEIDISDDSLMSDAIERLGQLEEGMQGMYDHLQEIPLQRIDDIESRQREQEGRNLIADDEMSSLLERVVALKGSNTGLQDALGIERARADSLQQCLGYAKEELKQVYELRAHES
ncbi:hypothetical protein Tco_1124158 [Tanacetum coccineum]|uniref:Uncharacterized protein n=1 Tax=Tanacetum coccineum TaxID=301880 RepID=A0ABQ5J8C6_9ASTR